MSLRDSNSHDYAWIVSDGIADLYWRSAPADKTLRRTEAALAALVAERDALRERVDSLVAELNLRVRRQT